jgi:hypothetical protein
MVGGTKFHRWILQASLVAWAKKKAEEKTKTPIRENQNPSGYTCPLTTPTRL